MPRLRSTASGVRGAAYRASSRRLAHCRLCVSGRIVMLYAMAAEMKCGCGCNKILKDFPYCQKVKCMEMNLEEFGTLHGQKLTSYAVLNFDFHDKGGVTFKGNRVYRVTHQADDRKNFFWCVEKIEDVGDIYAELYPQPFLDWKERLKTLGVGLDGSAVNA